MSNNIVFSENLSQKDFEKKVLDEMRKSIDFFEKELLKIRTSRAHTSLVDGIKVDLYGQFMPLRSIAVITVPEPTTIFIQPFDPSSVLQIEKALMQSDLGTQPRNDGKSIKIILPPMSQARRAELIKSVYKKQEEILIAIRKIRQDILTSLKQAEKDKKLSEDFSSRLQKSLQSCLDETGKNISKLVESKEKSLSE
jgi:ribosome recycling factor